MERIRCDSNIPIPKIGEEEECENSTGSSSGKKRKLDDEFVIKGATATGTRVLALPNGVAPCNPNIKALIDQVKPSVIQLVEDANMVCICLFVAFYIFSRI